MSSLEEKLKRISEELQSYRPQDVETRPEHVASCLHEVFEYDLSELSGGQLDAVDAEMLSVLCPGMDFAGWDIARAAFVDTETTGLAGGTGTVAFLIGLGYVSEGKFVVEQFFMEDYDVEGDMLARLCRKLEGFDWLVTFNGKCFDAPLISTRAVLNRIRAPLDELEHIDLLHAARRVYRKRLRQCSLGNLESQVLGRGREKDIPGALVPEMFFEYLRTGNFAPMRMVLEHNRMDVASMLTLLCALCAAVRQPEALSHADDAYSCARLHARAGKLDEAERFYRAAAGSSDSLKDLSILFRRQGRREEAAALWAEMIGAGNCGLFPYVELAKHYEHALADYKQALEMVEQAMVKLRSIGVPMGGAEYTQLARRRARLLARVQERDKGE